MNKNINALLMLLMVGGFAMPTGQLFAAGKAVVVDVEKEDEDLNFGQVYGDAQNQMESNADFQANAINADDDYDSKQEAYKGGAKFGLSFGISSAVMRIYNGMKKKLGLVNDKAVANEEAIRQQGVVIDRHDQNIKENGQKAAENKGNIGQINARVTSNDQRIQKVEDGRKAIDALLSVKGGVVTSSMGMVASVGHKIAPSIVSPVIRSAGAITLGIGLTAFAIQGFCIWPDKLAQRLSHLNKWGFSYGWYLGQALGYAAATASVCGGLFVVHKASQNVEASASSS